MTGRFDGPVVLVTGAGSGIGRVLALRFAAEGARVAVLFAGLGDDDLIKVLGESMGRLVRAFRPDDPAFAPGPAIQG